MAKSSFFTHQRIRLFLAIYKGILLIKGKMFYENGRFHADALYLSLFYQKKTGKRLNLNAPKSFNEKVQWRKLYDRNPLFPILADKFRVREYVKEKIGSDVLTKLFHVTKMPEDIPFDALPVKFVVKCNQGSKTNLFVMDKTKADFRAIVQTCNKWLKFRYGEDLGEWAYDEIESMIIVEEFLESNTYEYPEDYKFFMFDGKMFMLQIDIDRRGDHKRNLYDTNWNLISAKYVHENDDKYILIDSSILEKMKEYAEKLSKGIDFVRVDFYCINSKIIFGEMTFYPATGIKPFYPDDFDIVLGSQWKLPMKPVEQ